MSGLIDLLRRRIAAHGPLTVAEYMAEALGHPLHGYYRRRDPFGAEGDFTTAPEISQMFGEMVGLWCAVVWTQMNRPAPLRLVELGPGRGTLMADVLRAARALPEFAAALDVHLVETSPFLREKQRETLAGRTIAWHERIGDVPDGPVIVIANELFDALPIRQFLRRPDGGWDERLVGLDSTGENLCFLAAPSSAAAALLPPGMEHAPVGVPVEVSPAALLLMGEISARVVRHGGAALIVDYGHAQGAPGDTLQAVKDHAFHPVLTAPGEADLTAHVDFDRLAQAARQAGARVEGPIHQGAWLRRLGIEARAEALSRTAAQAQVDDIAAALHRLIDPEAMGDLFKAVAVVHPAQPPSPGFEDS